MVRLDVDGVISGFLEDKCWFEWLTIWSFIMVSIILQGILVIEIGLSLLALTLLPTLNIVRTFADLQSSGT